MNDNDTMNIKANKELGMNDNDAVNLKTMSTETDRINTVSWKMTTTDNPYFNFTVEYCGGDFDAKRTLKYELGWDITWPEAVKYFITALQAVGYVISDDKYDYITQRLEDVLN